MPSCWEWVIGQAKYSAKRLEAKRSLALVRFLYITRSGDPVA
ncbi:hypothetical protein OGM63_12000 [Plectonema radiosum NIES-515]|uniref:Uncharacterized protein n=1 Tax=Plectonema radiosum NIES-515 TaxID=2986073 RepID=A0ABT3B048_9CYAN|nr:hypothetical protein [Plectonema radiosum]MCV3214224.1 hypothetical protein [Plectonema radiosum NIES-515]